MDRARPDERKRAHTVPLYFCRALHSLFFHTGLVLQMGEALMYMSVANTPPTAVTWGGWYPRGMGDAAQGIQQLSGAASPAIAAAAAPSVAGILGVGTAVAVPLIGAAIVGITIGVIELLKLAKGCGQSCIMTSQWANQAEELLKQNIAAYFALPVPRPISARNAAINNFNVIWAQLEQLCGQPGTQAAGQRCISDRQRGACVWKQRADSPLLKYPGEPQPGDCWNWFSGYLDPIANDPNVAPDSIVSNALSSASDAVGSVVSAASSSPLGALALLAGAGILLWSLT